jgi:hypothetical protein
VKAKSCQNCTFALQVSCSTGTEPLLVCINKFDSPGQLHLIEQKAPCRNFQPNRRIIGRRKPPLLNDKSIRLIPLTQGKFAIVGAEDYEWLSQYKWCALKTHNNKFYAVRRKNNKTIIMHRQIMNAPAGLVVDHIDGNSLNNRKTNLRICTQAQNIHNSQPRRNRSSKYKGVFWDKVNKKWSTNIRKGDKRIYLGGFDDEIEAALAYDRKAAELFGEFAYLNFPGNTD